ncbi:MAG: peptidylprolyl isomerase [Bacteroidota bacterium]|nr:peptidylprolyl isomerase [Bacteroidota bacterium]
MPKIKKPSETLVQSGVACILSLLTIFILSCKTNIGNEVLLEIGKYKFVVDDYQKLKSDFEKRKQAISEDQIEKRITEDGYILAYALDNRFDTIALLKNRLKYASRLYASEVNGFVWNHKVKPFLKVSKEEVQEAFNKRSSEYELNLIYFPQKSLSDKHFNEEVKIKSASDFFLLKNRVATNPDIKFITYRKCYPFYPIGNYIKDLNNAKIGHVWGPVETLNGYYDVYLAGIKKITQPAFEKEKSKIEEELLNSLTEKYIWESQKDILSKANPYWHDPEILEMVSKYKPDKKEWPGVDKRKVLMDYMFQGKRLSYRVSDFIEFTQCQPMFLGSLSNDKDVKGMMKNYLFDIYLFEEAQKLNIDADNQYQLFRRQYLNKIYIQYYKEKNMSRLSFGEEMIKKYYEENRSLFKSFESAIVSIYKFKDKQSAFSGMNQIRQHLKLSPNAKIDSKKISGLLSVSEKVKLVVSDTSGNNINFIRVIVQMNEGQLSMPIEVNGEMSAINLLKKNGEATLPYNYVKEEIRRKLLQMEEKKLYDKLMDELKAKYPVKVNRLKEYIHKK